MYWSTPYCRRNRSPSSCLFLSFVYSNISDFDMVLRRYRRFFWLLFLLYTIPTVNQPPFLFESWINFPPSNWRGDQRGVQVFSLSICNQSTLPEKFTLGDFMLWWCFHRSASSLTLSPPKPLKWFLHMILKHHSTTINRGAMINCSLLWNRFIGLPLQ